MKIIYLWLPVTLDIMVFKFFFIREYSPRPCSVMTLSGDTIMSYENINGTSMSRLKIRIRARTVWSLPPSGFQRYCKVIFMLGFQTSGVYVHLLNPACGPIMRHGADFGCSKARWPTSFILCGCSQFKNATHNRWQSERFKTPLWPACEVEAHDLDAKVDGKNGI